MPVCKGYHGYFASCGGMTGALGSTPLHELGGMQAATRYREMQKNRARLEAAHGKAAIKDRIVAAHAKAFEGASRMTPEQTNILRQEYQHRLQLLGGKSLSKTERDRLRFEATTLHEHIKRADRMEEIRQEKLARMQRAAAQLERDATAKEHDLLDRKGAWAARYLADKAHSEVEAFTHREAVTYTHFDKPTLAALHDLWGEHLPRRSQMAAALGLGPGHDIRFYTKRGKLFADIHGPGYDPLLARDPRQPPVAHAVLRIAKDQNGDIHTYDVTAQANRMNLAELRERLEALHTMLRDDTARYGDTITV